MIVYSGQTLILLAAGLTLPWTLQEDPSTALPQESPNS
jgi:hypothetical protein